MKIVQFFKKLFSEKKIERSKMREMIGAGIKILEEDLTFLVNSGSYYTRKRYKLTDAEYADKLNSINQNLRVTLIDNVIAMQFLEAKGWKDRFWKLRNGLLMDMQSEYLAKQKEAEKKSPPLVKFKPDIQSIRSQIRAQAKAN